LKNVLIGEFGESIYWSHGKGSLATIYNELPLQAADQLKEMQRVSPIKRHLSRKNTSPPTGPTGQRLKTDMTMPLPSP